ncbi:MULTISPECIES: TetR/AcrR family transcriptional regulator [unclassified Arthrobacter]|uniref:TetR/AcrR family transcriptional regulator n=1 Tax=unclassified Arthrobacter TaxID=235627 RepID=UPI001F31F578|nr:TetR/AcrR family transcriptional regulator [Arthrobacter sp. FW305-BF8]UKA55745.1 TetR/AcrR family transcriptional regulator [Arthrobacter sp. FW305-BF8]
MSASTSLPSSRRELNKAVTRQAITDATLALLRRHGPGKFTIEDIAEAAGISRRTFFNYFTSTEAAIASVTNGFLDSALEQFRRRPADEPILESARAALVALADPMTVAPLAELFGLTQGNPLMARSELEAWDHCTEQIVAAARERSPQNPRTEQGTGTEQVTRTEQVTDQDELYVRALAGSVVSCGKAAMDVWFRRCGPDLSPESLAILRQLLIDSMGLLGSGFAGPPSDPPSKQSPAKPSTRNAERS